MKGKMQQTTVFPVILVLLVITMVFMIFEADIANAAGGWKPFQFTAGQNFIYELEMEEYGIKSSGNAEISLSDAGGDKLKAIIKGKFDGVSFEISAIGNKNDSADMHAKVVMALFGSDLGFKIPQAILCTFWFPWWDSPYFGEEFHPGWEFTDTDDEGDTYYAKVVEKESYAGVEGYLLKVQENGDELLSFCVTDKLPLLLMVKMISGDMDEKMVYTARLTSYTKK